MEEGQLKASQMGNSGYYTAVKGFCGGIGQKCVGNQASLACATVFLSGDTERERATLVASELAWQFVMH